MQLFFFSGFFAKSVKTQFVEAVIYDCENGL